MRPFTYRRATDPSFAIQALAVATGNPLTEAEAQPLAGGTTLIDLMKLDVMRPQTIVDINPLAPAWSAVSLDGGNLRLGAMAQVGRRRQRGSPEKLSRGGGCAEPRRQPAASQHGDAGRQRPAAHALHLFP